MLEFTLCKSPILFRIGSYHQLGLSLVIAPSAPPAIVGTEATSPPSTLGLTDEQSTLMRPNLMTSGGHVHVDTIFGHVPRDQWSIDR